MNRASTITLKAANGQYISAEYGGGIDPRQQPDAVALTASRDAVGGFERFTLIDLGTGWGALRTFDGHYITAEGGGGSFLRTEAVQIGAWESFRLIDDGAGGRHLRCWDQVHYLCAEIGSARRELTATRTVPQSWETFTVDGLRPPLPPIPTREQVCGVRLHFQGLMYDTAQYGRIPAWWFPQLSAEDRQRALANHDAVGDTHVDVNVSGAYREAGTLWPDALKEGRDFWFDLATLKPILLEIVQARKVVALFLGGDGQSVHDHPGAGDYNDPVGDTYGYSFVVQQLPRLVAALKGDAGSDVPDGIDLTPYLLFCPGYDGVFYGWTPDQVRDFGTRFRELLPSGYLMLEHQPGRIPVGNGPRDYAPGGMMDAYDVIASEFPNGLERTADPNPDTNPGSQIWMVVGRLVQPYHRPADQPAPIDPGAPFYLHDSPRGPRFYCALEWDEYRYCRGQVDDAGVEIGRQYLKGLGCAFTG